MLKKTSQEITEETSGTTSLSVKNMTCIISSGTVIEGKFTSSEDVQVNGTIKGDIWCKKHLTMGTSGWIEGTLRAHSAVITGYVKGTILVQNSLHLKSSARIEGIILAKDLQVEEGATYNGECKIGERFVKEEKLQTAVA